jgi:GMP synthase C terminal domain
MMQTAETWPIGKLFIVPSTDGMTADFYHFDHDFLSRTATRIINEVRASTASSMTSHRSRRGRSSGSEGEYRGVVSDSRGHSSESYGIDSSR